MKRLAKSREAGQRLAHSRPVEDPRADGRQHGRADVDMHEPDGRRPLVLGENGPERVAAEVVQHARRDDDVGGLGEREGIGGDEAAT